MNHNETAHKKNTSSNELFHFIFMYYKKNYDL